MRKKLLVFSMVVFFSVFIILTSGMGTLCVDDFSITFDGSGSSDPDGEIAQYMWDFGDDSTGDSVNPAYAYTEAGEYTASLTV